MKTSMARIRRAACRWVLLLSTVPCAALAQPAASPPPRDSLLDCSLHRYGDRLDEAVAATLARIGPALDTSAALQAARRSGSAYMS